MNCTNNPPPLPFVQKMAAGRDPRFVYFSWPDDKLSWMNQLIHQRALEAVNPEEGFVRNIIAASYNLDAFNPDGLMFESSEQMLRYIALYAYKEDLEFALRNFSVADALALVSPTPAG